MGLRGHAKIIIKKYENVNYVAHESSKREQDTQIYFNLMQQAPLMHVLYKLLSCNKIK